MNERHSDSSGLPLRAMVMVLLFLGVVFLLVGLQAMGGGDDSSADDSPVAVSSSSTPSPTPSEAPAPAAKAEVRVYNTSETAGAAENTANQLREAGWNVTETGNLTIEGLTATTVYFSDAPGERKSADEVGQLLSAPVEPRAPELAEQPPGVVVAVAG
ncbi:LytR C-terminal domain-containing protein [Mycobacterium sp. ITM-2016-00318]|uniref:LytR C-terminal domain-containing protein n=1 Tax=Mycobacterium sp. ITM-2016-00318 TaxID=2099693 RepID=UPI000CF8EEAE|nr:LytR C-terminal domain-containing protein [Mycobacterium sp. ITM-2016-00318]WNG93355.1 LytR C-terminal domain-containing protein [Mycobacterium sp. ITM-2016-00318]